MCPLRTAIIAALLTSGAYAQDGVGISQTSDGLQSGSNTIDTRSLEALTDEFMTEMMDFSKAGNLNQQGVNAVNAITYGGDLASAVQHFNGQQSLENIVALRGYVLTGDNVQYGLNIAGSASANTLTFADQLMGADGRQLILNSVEAEILAGMLSQRGSNTANLATAERAIGTANQTIELGAVQRVDNVLKLAATAAVGAYISQYGENYGNMMISDVVDEANRVFAGDQIVHNVVTLEEMSDAKIDQRGVNIANFIQANSIGRITQVSVGVQDVFNEVRGPGNVVLTGQNISQSEENTVNLSIVGGDEVQHDNGVLSIDQTADYPQSSNAENGSQTGNSAVIVR